MQFNTSSGRRTHQIRHLTEKLNFPLKILEIIIKVVLSKCSSTQVQDEELIRLGI